MEERYTDKLARYILIASGILLAFFVCRLFRKVLLLGGTLGGMLGILVTVPTYTVLRVVAVKFFGDAKVVRRMVGNE